MFAVSEIPAVNTFFVSMVLLEGVLLTPVFVERDSCRGFWPSHITDVTRRTVAFSQDPRSFPPNSHLTIYLWPFCLHFLFTIWVSFCCYWICMLDHCLPNQPGLSASVTTQQSSQQHDNKKQYCAIRKCYPFSMTILRLPGYCSFAFRHPYSLKGRPGTWHHLLMDTKSVSIAIDEDTD